MKLYKLSNTISNYLDEEGNLVLNDLSVLNADKLNKINEIIVRKGHNMRGPEDCLQAITRFVKNNNGKILKEIYPRWVETISYVLGLKKKHNEVSEFKPKLESMAIKTLGYTNDPSKAGFILQNGKMINLSAEGYSRDLDHREVSSFISDLMPQTDEKRTSSDNLQLFLEHTGAIRMAISNKAFVAQIVKIPSSGQLKTIKDCLIYTNGACNVDLESHNLGNTSVNHSSGTNINKVINDILKFMNN